MQSHLQQSHMCVFEKICILLTLQIDHKTYKGKKTMVYSSLELTMHCTWTKESEFTFRGGFPRAVTLVPIQSHSEPILPALIVCIWEPGTVSKHVLTNEQTRWKYREKGHRKKCNNWEKILLEDVPICIRNPWVLKFKE